MAGDSIMRQEPRKATLEEARAVRGNQIAQIEGAVRRVADDLYFVKSQSHDEWYEVASTEAGWFCSCKDHAFRGVKCKHIFAVELSYALRQTVQRQVKIGPVGMQTCLFCYSKNLVKDGLLHNKGGDIQRWLCRGCGKRFTNNLGFEGMRAKPEAITLAMQTYFGGSSLRNTQKVLALQGVKVSHVAILGWLRKYVRIMGNYLDQIQPNLSPTWADELWIKVKGDMKYLFSMMDDQTRFWIAQEVADTKERHDARSLFHKSAEVAGKVPSLLITDGLKSYEEAARKEFQSNHGNSRPIHIKDIALAGKIHNNKMERMNGEVRDREKTMRGLKTVNSPIIKGMQLYHNYIRPHEGLNGDTPADRVGIKIEGDDKWLTIIQNAKHAELDGESHA